MRKKIPLIGLSLSINRDRGKEKRIECACARNQRKSGEEV